MLKFIRCQIIFSNVCTEQPYAISEKFQQQFIRHYDKSHSFKHMALSYLLSFCYLNCEKLNLILISIHIFYHKYDWILLSIFTNHMYYLFWKVLSHIFFIFYVTLFVISLLICRNFSYLLLVLYITNSFL